MPTHFCISNPCWICHPELSPQNSLQESYNYNKNYTSSNPPPPDEVAELLHEAIVDLFNLKMGDVFYHKHLSGKITIDQLKMQKDKAIPGSLEEKLIDAIIGDIEFRKYYAM